MIVAVAGGKGGVGTSTVAYNLAAALGAVVVDADLAMADLPCGPGPDLHDVLAGRADAHEAVRAGPVSVLPCGRSLAGARAADLSALADVLTGVEPAFGHVVVDCPAGLRADAGVPLAVADGAVVVASPRHWALADAVRTRDLARDLGTGLVAVALNRVVDDAPLPTVRDVLGAAVVAIPADPRVARSVEAERPVVREAPESRAAAGFAALASAVRRASGD